MAAFYNYCGLSSISLPYILTPKVKPILSGSYFIYYYIIERNG